MTSFCRALPSLTAAELAREPLHNDARAAVLQPHMVVHSIQVPCPPCCCLPGHT